jgi:uracil-DNA glycosylase family 4
VDESLKRQLRLRADFLKSEGLDYTVDPPKIKPASPVQEDQPMKATPRVSAADLKGVREILGECTRCKLWRGRTQIVFGVGNPHAKVMFVGEGPGADEDRQGIPFVGRAGQLLTKIITQGMGISREEVYIANVVKCRPPQNRDPEPDEVDACFPFLRAQIQAIKPEAIVALGRPASHNLLKTMTPITKLRGTWGEFEGIPVMPTFHPSYLLRNPAAKKEVWEDIQEVMNRVGIKPPKRPSR